MNSSGFLCRLDCLLTLTAIVGVHALVKFRCRVNSGYFGRDGTKVIYFEPLEVVYSPSRAE